jgi:hypothetical protein
VQAQLSARGGTLYVRDLTDGTTTVDGAPLAAGREVVAAPGAVVSFAGATFTVAAAVGKAVGKGSVAAEVLPAGGQQQLRVASEATAAAAELRALEKELGVTVDAWRQMLARTARQAAGTVVSSSGVSASDDTRLMAMRGDARQAMVEVKSLLNFKDPNETLSEIPHAFHCRCRIAPRSGRRRAEGEGSSAACSTSTTSTTPRSTTRRAPPPKGWATPKRRCSRCPPRIPSPDRSSREFLCESWTKGSPETSAMLRDRVFDGLMASRRGGCARRPGVAEFGSRAGHQRRAAAND